ncbi:unnamed protein product, partial [Owenia fusiformis]
MAKKLVISDDTDSDENIGDGNNTDSDESIGDGNDMSNSESAHVEKLKPIRPGPKSKTTKKRVVSSDDTDESGNEERNRTELEESANISVSKSRKKLRVVYGSSDDEVGVTNEDSDKSNLTLREGLAGSNNHRQKPGPKSKTIMKRNPSFDRTKENITASVEDPKTTPGPRSRITKKHATKVKRDNYPFLCFLCDKFDPEDLSQLIQHLREHMDYKHFVCKECGTAFVNWEDGLLHLEEPACKMSSIEYTPAFDETTLLWDTVKKSYFGGLKKDEEEGANVEANDVDHIKCTICEKHIPAGQVDVHSFSHYNQTPFHCDFNTRRCKFKSDNQDELKRHLMKEHGQLESVWFIHMRTITRVPFKDHNALWEDLTLFIGLGYRASIEHLVYTCSICKVYETDKEYKLRTHLVAQHMNPYKCPYCSRKSGLYRIMLPHIKKDHKELPFKEPVLVGNTSAREINRLCMVALRRAKNITLKAEKIDTSTTNTTNTLTTANTQTNSSRKPPGGDNPETIPIEQKLKCTLCGIFTCKSVDAFRYHVCRHFGYSPYTCKKCHNVFRTHDKAILHMASQHPDLQKPLDFIQFQSNPNIESKIKATIDAATEKFNQESKEREMRKLASPPSATVQRVSNKPQLTCQKCGEFSTTELTKYAAHHR